MNPLFSFQNLTLTYPHKTLFKNASLTVVEGEKIGVLGLNGHGKSSLFKIVCNLAKPDTTTPSFNMDKSSNFSVFLIPQDMPQGDNLTLDDIFYLFQPEISLYRNKMRELEKRMMAGETSDQILNQQADLFDKLNSLQEDHIYSRYQSYVKHLGLDSDSIKDFSKLSGGEKRKVALALGLSATENLILWDEPTNHLDLETIEWLEDEFQSLQKTLMIISHDRSFLNNVADRIIHIKTGKIHSFKGNYQEYLEFLREEQAKEAKHLDKLNNFQRREKAWIQRGVSARRTKSKKRIDDYQNLLDQIQTVRSQAKKMVNIQLQSSQRKSKIIAEAEELSLSYGDNLLLDKVNFAIQKGDKIAIMGANGTGKTSLLKMLLKLNQPSDGKLRILDNLTIGHFSQNKYELPEEASPWEFIGEGSDFIVSNTGDKRHVAGYLENFLFQSDELKRPIKTFSGGEKSRLQLAKFMKDAQDIWIFDEPTNDLDLETIGILEEELKNYEGSLILVSHDRSFVNNVANKCWLIHDKKLEMFEGGLEQVEAFLETNRLEAQLRSMTPADNCGPNGTAGKAEKLSNKEKIRLGKIEGEVFELESRIESLKQKLSGFDYNSMNETQLKELELLNKEIPQKEELLNKLMDEWSELEAKKERAEARS